MQQLAETTQEKQVVEYPQKTVITTKYGLIRLVGEKEKREIKWSTYQKIMQLPQNFNGRVEIKELDLVVPLSQIALMTTGERSETQYKAFVGLPTERIALDPDFNIIRASKRELEAKYDKFYYAICHYNEKDEKEYILDYEKIKELVLVAKNEDGIFTVREIVRYGELIFPKG